MKTIYQQPIMAVRLPRLEASYLDHFASNPTGEDDEFNSKHRDDEDFVEEDDRSWGETDNSLW